MKFILCLCDLTGIMAEPWLDAGYSAILIDPQHEQSSVTTHGGGGVVIKVSAVIDSPDSWSVIKNHINDIVFVAGFPPCTDVAVSGAAHFGRKRKADPHFQTKAALIAEQCKVIGSITGAPWFFENPVSVFASIFGKPDFTFNPYEYGGYLPENDSHPTYPDYIAPRDAYPKKTCLWVGNGFVMPKKISVQFDGGYSAQHTKLGGKSDRTKNIRSATPRGFAKAVFDTHGSLAQEQK